MIFPDMGNDGSSASGMDGIDCLCNRDGLAGNVVGTFFAETSIASLMEETTFRCTR